jgi:outer membrane protein
VRSCVNYYVQLNRKHFSLVFVFAGVVGLASAGSAQTTGQNPLPQATPATARPTPQTQPSPPATMGQQPQPPSPQSTPATSTSLSLDEALRLSTSVASAYQQAGLNERLAEEDVKQARAAFLPRVSAPLSYLYTSPAMGLPPGTPREQSFIANNAIGETQAYVGVAGELDVAGRLRATVARNRALLDAAHAGTEVARRALAQVVIENYYGLGLATAQRVAAEESLAAAEEFERVTGLLLSGGEVAPVDFTRAQLQTLARRDELEKARANEIVAAGSLRILVGYEFSRPIATTDLVITPPNEIELQQFKVEDVARRPEFTQFEAQLRAARQDIRIARADRLPQLSYSILGGFDTDSIRPPRLKQHTGASAGITLTIPIFDWGATRSKERQARLREQIAESENAQAKLGFTQQFFVAQTQAASAARRIRLATEGIAQAQKNLSASIARYRAGEAQIIEVTDAMTTLAGQRSNYYQALFDYQTALARLKQATGQ